MILSKSLRENLVGILVKCWHASSCTGACEKVLWKSCAILCKRSLHEDLEDALS